MKFHDIDSYNFDALGPIRVQRVTTATFPVFTALTDTGRVLYNTDTQKFYYGDNDSWVEFANASDLSAHIAATAAHGATGAVVGTTNSQTLTNKTLTTPIISDLTNIQHDHSTVAKGGLIPAASLPLHTHAGAGQGGTVSHTALTDKGTNTHSTIDSHISTANSHIGSSTAHSSDGAVVGINTLNAHTTNRPQHGIVYSSASIVINASVSGYQNYTVPGLTTSKPTIAFTQSVQALTTRTWMAPPPNPANDVYTYTGIGVGNPTSSFVHGYGGHSSTSLSTTGNGNIGYLWWTSYSRSGGGWESRSLSGTVIDIPADNTIRIYWNNPNFYILDIDFPGQSTVSFVITVYSY